jgi:hypothetical protein
MIAASRESVCTVISRFYPLILAPLFSKNTGIYPNVVAIAHLIPLKVSTLTLTENYSRQVCNKFGT